MKIATARGTSDDRNRKQKRIHDGANGRLAARFQAPSHCRIVDHEIPCQGRLGRSRHVEIVWSIGIRRQTIHDTIAVSVSIEVIVKPKNVEL